MDGSITFDSNDLQTFDPDTGVGIITNSIDHTDLPDKTLNLAQIANTNRATISSVNYSGKSIPIAGAIKGSSAADLDDRIDAFKGYMTGEEKNLDIGFGSAARRYIATANSVTVQRPGGKLFALFSVEFVLTDPFGRATSDTTALSATARTNGTYNDNYTFLGNAPSQLPVVTITLNSVTDGDGAYISIGNSATGQQIIVTRNWDDDDVLEVDCYNKTVKVNGTEADFTGGFPEFAPGAQTIDYSDNFTARDFDETIKYRKLYL